MVIKKKFRVALLFSSLVIPMSIMSPFIVACSKSSSKSEGKVKLDKAKEDFNAIIPQAKSFVVQKELNGTIDDLLKSTTYEQLIFFIPDLPKPSPTVETKYKVEKIDSKKCKVIINFSVKDETTIQTFFYIDGFDVSVTNTKTTFEVLEEFLKIISSEKHIIINSKFENDIDIVRSCKTFDELKSYIPVLPNPKKILELITTYKKFLLQK